MRRQIKQTADFCRWSIYLTVIVAGVTLVVARLLVNQLYLYEENIEAWLSSATLTEVATETARGEWLGLFPVVQLEQITLGDPEQPAATADMVRAEPNYLQSFQHANAIWEDLRVESLRLDLVQLADGSWTLRGLNPEPAGGNSAFSQLLEMFFRSRLIRIDGLQANFHFRNGRSLMMNFGELVAQNDAQFHRLRVQAEIQGAANRLTYLMELQGDASRPAQMRGAGYMALAGADIGGIVDVLAGSLLDLDSGSPMPASGALWFDFDGNGAVRAEGSISMRQFALEGSEPLSLEAGLVFESPSANQWQLRMEQLQVQSPNRQLNMQQLGLGREANRMQVTGAGVELSSLGDLLLQANMLPARAGEVLRQLDPAGELEALQLEIPLGDRSNWQLSANLSGVNLGSWKRSPEVENLSGYLETTAAAGRFYLQGGNTRVHFEEVFAEPLVHEDIQGQISWRVDPRNASLLLYSSLLESRGTYGEGVSQFRLLTPLDDSFASDFTLVAGVRNGRLADWKSFVPVTAEPDLLEWLERSQMQGRMASVGFVYRGKLRESLSRQRHIELIAELEGASLEFAEGWPEASSLHGRFSLADGEARFTGLEGELAGIELELIDVQIEEKELRVQADTRGDLSNYRSMLADSPLSADLSAALEPLVLAGPANARLDLAMSLDDPDAADAGVEIVLQNNELLLPELNLSVHSLNGRLLYTDRTLRSSGLVGTIWGRQFQGEFIPDGEQVALTVSGSLEAQALQSWGMLTLPAGLSGELELSGNFRFAPAPGINQYRFYSDTQGLALDVPGILGKQASQSRDLELVLVDAAAGVAIELNWGELLQAAIDLDRQGEISQAAFAVNAERPSKVPGQLRGHVILDQLNINDWVDYLGEQDAASGLSEIALQPDIAIRSYSTHFSGLDLGPIQGSLGIADKGAQLGFQSAFGGGQVSLLQREGGYPVHFEWLDLKSLPRPAAIADPERNAQEQIYDPSRLIPLDVSVAGMYFGQRALGEWQFQVQPLARGARLNQIQAEFPGGRIAADSQSQLLWALDDQGNASSQLRLQGELGNVADVFSMFNQPRAMTSADGELQLELDWQGAPWQARLEQMQGLARLQLNQGNFSAEVQGVGNAMMRLVGLVNIQNWGRRLQFDFSDLTGDGTAYDSLRADVKLLEGEVITNQPIDIDLATGRLRLEGEFDLVDNAVEGRLIANLPVRDNLTWITGVVAGLPAAAGVWLFGELFKNELDSFARVTYQISGSLDAPELDPESAEDI